MTGFFVLMIRRTPRSTRTDTLFPYTTLFRAREATVLEGFAEEEAAKALILVDLIRCPPKQVARRAAAMIKTFYDHLGRLIYDDAQHWCPTDVDQLREYVDQACEGHALDGYAVEYIVPYWKRFNREAVLHSDKRDDKDGVHHGHK